MYLVPLLSESFFILATQIQTQTNNGYFTKIHNEGTCESATFGKIHIFNINTRFVRFFNTDVEVKQIKTILIL
jgi:predicted RNA-binding protein with RPS1 domain